MTPTTVGAVVLALTLHGAPLPRTVDVYRLATPVVELEPEPEPKPTQGARVRLGVLLGAFSGCALGMGLVMTTGESPSAGRTVHACALVGGIAAMGAVIGATTASP